MAVLQRITHHDLEGIRVGRYRGGLTTACIVYRLGDIVVDTGPPNQWKHVRRFLDERRIGNVLLTHHHEDHSGNGANLQRALNCPVHAPAASAEPLARGFRMGLMQKVIWGRPRRFQPHALSGDIPLENGARLVPVPTPGHSDDMTCLLEPDRGWLFAGDVYIASKPKYFRYDENLNDQIDSLRRLLDIEFDTLLCSHRGVLENGKQALRAKLDFLEEFRENARELRRQGRSVRQITRELLGPEGGMTYTTFGVFSRRNMVVSALNGDA